MNDVNCEFNQVNPITTDEAKAKVEVYIKDNFKGYTVTDIKSAERFRGTAYIVDVKDVSGNIFNFFVRCDGKLKGPIHKVRFNQ